MIRVLIADDQTLVRDGFRMILDAQDDIEVVGEAADGAEARRRRPASCGPTSCSWTSACRDSTGSRRPVSIVRQLADIHVLILTTFDLDEYVYAAMRAGASGFLLKDVPRAQLIAGVRTVAAGDALLAPCDHTAPDRAVRQATARIRSVRCHPRSTNSPRASSRCCDWSRAAVPTPRSPGSLCISEATVKTHISHALQKLGLRDRVQAVVFAYESGLVEPDSQ